MLVLVKVRNLQVLCIYFVDVEFRPDEKRLKDIRERYEMLFSRALES